MITARRRRVEITRKKMSMSTCTAFRAFSCSALVGFGAGGAEVWVSEGWWVVGDEGAVEVVVAAIAGVEVEGGLEVAVACIGPSSHSWRSHTSSSGTSRPGLRSSGSSS